MLYSISQSRYITQSRHDLIFLIYFYCRISVYFLLFGLSGEPFLELTPPSPMSGKIRLFIDSKGTYRTNGPSSLPYLPTPSPGTTLSSSPTLSGGTSGGSTTTSGNQWAFQNLMLSCVFLMLVYK